MHVLLHAELGSRISWVYVCYVVVKGSPYMCPYSDELHMCVSGV